MDPKLLDRREFDAAQLMRDHPPRFRDGNKRAVFAKSLRPGEVPAGKITFSRWTGAALPAGRRRAPTRVVERKGFFVYGEAASAGTANWHMNFAMGDCFGAYDGPLLAQDELQVLEHPALGSLREAAIAEGFSIRCIEGDGHPTPVLVSGVERRVHLDTTPKRQTPSGLYGNYFARADKAAVRRAAERIEPPTISNIVALEAPACGSGTYGAHQIEGILATAFAGFRAARLETERVLRASSEVRAVVHTGWWGCGAYGGNRELMALLQLVAAELAGVELVFYCVTDEGSETLAEVVREYERLPAKGAMSVIINRILANEYEWGESDGT